MKLSSELQPPSLDRLEQHRQIVQVAEVAKWPAKTYTVTKL
ncbi:hypothetical protein [uncultured Rothia sp.]